MNRIYGNKLEMPIQIFYEYILFNRIMNFNFDIDINFIF